ncbi:hypothetical protein [Herbaspirillum sp. CAH-3]|uniref:hypothetical protein n=1 Tax=Herbaspirillum sp. CAH-3 TaxID=2605746 RepID=UPI0012AC9DCA|nr:hypothetical protein [Herbaspirillum sp. CAH-3]MRT30883.1 hypothetical protein [Herbaspirillum sp. CAH-3]
MTTTITVSAKGPETIPLQENQALNLSVSADGSGAAYLLDDVAGAGNSTQSWTLAAGQSQKLGPYANTRRVRVVATAGTIQATIVQAVLNQAPGTPRTITASDTVVATDVNGLITYNSASAGTLTIPNDATGGFSANEFVAAYQAGAGAVSFVAGSGVTLRSPSGVAAAVQYGTIAVQRVGPNEWALV